MTETQSEIPKPVIKPHQSPGERVDEIIRLLESDPRIDNRSPEPIGGNVPPLPEPSTGPLNVVGTQPIADKVRAGLGDLAAPKESSDK